MAAQVFRFITDFPEYSVSNDGVVISNKGREPRALRVTIASSGFLTVVLFQDGKRYRRHVSGLVADAFLPDPQDPQKNTIWHKDGDLLNCEVENIRWETRPKVLEWNEMHRRGTPKIRLGPIEETRSGRIYDTVYDCAISVGMTETEVFRSIMRWEAMHQPELGPYRVAYAHLD